ncbi:MAG TPA: serine/threonine-protein kinase [Chthoniobacterales bacterium]|nr:serine/threonine-protein kinase [Chthoniobacterales bacterium]
MIGAANADGLVSPDKGRRIGNYELIRELGRGGMGTVWLARRADRQFEKLVAIKLLKRGTDTDEVLRRFQTERQILARLEHPNIARLLDGGVTDDDLPYFVMEYVDGRPITEFCRDHALTIEERLRLFLKICSALQFAHQNLVVHRDLKPGNILVLPDGEPKLLDFGIAKLLGPDEASLEVTMAEHQRFTPAYASPEQVRGGPITTVSDVYALGTLLYEILTGKNAHLFSVPHPAPTELFRVVTQEEPPRPSAAATEAPVARHLRGDLDNIILKALRKEPSRRYSGVGAFAADLRRHLENKPVTARRDTLSYRTAKFVQRNKIAVTGAALILLALIGGIIATAREARIARTERSRAEKRFNDVRNLADSLLSELSNEAEKLPGSTKLRSILVQRTLAYLDSIAAEAGDNSGLQAELATAYQKVGDIQGNTYYSNIGDIPGAIVSYEKAIALRQSLSNAAQSPEAKHELALTHEGYADVLWGANRLSDTLTHYRNAQTILEALSSSPSSSTQIRFELSRVYHKLGDLYGNVDYPNLGDTATGVANARESLRLREALARQEPSNSLFLDVLSESYLNLGIMQRITGDLQGALQSYRDAISVQEKFRAAEPNNPIFRRHIAFIQKHVAVALREAGRIDAALDVQRSSLNAAEEEAAADSKNTQAKRNLAVSTYGLAYLLWQHGETDQAREDFRNAVAILEKLFADSPSNAQVRRDLFVAYLELGDTYTLPDDRSVATDCYTRAKAMLAPASSDKRNTQDRSDLATLSLSLAAWERNYGSASAALENARQAAATREELLAANPSNCITRRDLAEAYAELGADYERLATTGQTKSGSAQAAEESYQKSLNLWQEMERKGTLAGAYVTKPAELSAKLANLKKS